jgi:DNA-binding CsgD family transcriptional regulator
VIAKQTRLSDLSPRQRQIVRLASEGLADKEIASRLGIAARTVRQHLQLVFRRTGVSTRNGLLFHFFNLVLKA